ncbi:MAG: hypothetical protein ACKPKO_43385, partial [Candidatus Fonsibacter sp.]
MAATSHPVGATLFLWERDYQGVAFKHLAVSTTTAALDACVLWDEDLYDEMQVHVFALRGTRAGVVLACRDG